MVIRAKAQKGKAKAKAAKSTDKSTSHSPSIATASEGADGAAVKGATDKAKGRVSISKVRGRPMLSWVGKRPLRAVTAFPAQPVEVHGSTDPGATLQTDQVMWQGWPDTYPRGGLLFHGDNKDVLAHLLANGFRGKANLIYIDPPFDSGADYVRRVTLRGPTGKVEVDGETYTLGEQVQYTDIWANDNYLQFMYERLLLLKELLEPNGYIIVHCDWRKTHHLRCLLDEIFGGGGFRNEVYWYFYNKMHDDRKGTLPRATNTLLVYANGDSATFHRLATPRAEAIKQLKRVKVNGVLVNLRDEAGQLVYQESDAKTLDNIWAIPLIPPADVRQKTDYPTQKPEALLEIALLAYTNPGDLVLDAFVGSGTTTVVAQRLGRRWIGCDINKGAIQWTIKRQQAVIAEQLEAESSSGAQQELISTNRGSSVPPAQLGFMVCRVNDYDLAIQHNEVVNLACEHIGITRTLSDSFFSGTLGKKLAKIVPFGHPLSPADLEEVRAELEVRPAESRDVVVVCLGKEQSVDGWLAEWNRMRIQGDTPNKISILELRSDPKYGKFIVHKPALARIQIRRNKSKEGDRIEVEIKDFVSPSIVERLQSQDGLLAPKIPDWRAMVDSVMIDTQYDGKVFNIMLADVPARKHDYVQGTYQLAAPNKETAVAVKVTDMLGEEVLVIVKV